MNPVNTSLLFKKKSLLFWVSYPFLYILSLIYWLILFLVKLKYKLIVAASYRPIGKVISVGNITVGGTGKTPLVEWIVAFLKKQNKKAGVIIRGYHKPKSAGSRARRDIYFKVGDEASLLMENLGDSPILVGSNKVASVRQLDRQNYQVAILDDGFQHWPLSRDLDVVAIDSNFSFSGQKLLPLGRLREPLNCLKRADVFIITKCDLCPENINKLKQELKSVNPKALIACSIYQSVCLVDIRTNEQLALEKLAKDNEPALMLAGIVNPVYFRKLLGDAKINVTKEFIFADHYEYRSRDVLAIKKFAKQEHIKTIITTQKDAMRLRHLVSAFNPLRIIHLKISCQIVENKNAFTRKLLEAISR